MLAWLGKKSSKSKQQNPPELARKVDFAAPASRSDHRRLSPAVDEKLKSFDEAGLLNPGNSPRSSREFGVIEGSSSGFSGFESDGTPWPLPRPSISSTQSLGNDLRVHASGSASVSSVSSSESSDDHPLLQDNAQLGVYRANSEDKVNSRPKSPGPARGNTPTMSPRHPQLSCSTLDSPTGKQEDGKALSHPLPLPPGSPSSPHAALTYPRTSGVPESLSHVISKWKKGRLLGRGTFGHVYLGFNSESGHLCAIKEVKVLSDDQLSKECLRQLNQEISLLNQLSHPNIVQYYGSELGEESLTVFLEYISGGSIQRLLQEYGPFKEPVIQNYTRKILSGLAYLHGRNTVHRDIKGANILVDPNGEIKLADFGMAKHITACSSMLSFKGSPYWMAPEVVMNTNGYSLPVDIWSLGCTILEMAMAKPPWSQFEGVAAIFKIGNSKDLPEIPDHFSSDAKSFVKQCLQRDPTTRPTAFELLDHPFVRDQTGTGGVANGNMTRGTVPFTYDGGRTQPILEPQSKRANITPIDRDCLTLPAPSRAMKSQRECARTFASMPVSPCSSPLRQNAAARRSCFPSPHPAYPVMVPQRSRDVNGYSAFPVRASLDLLPESSLNRSMSPTRSPRIR